MSRMVNSLLQCLDELKSESILHAATILDAELDSVIWRRFDTKMKYDALTDSETFTGSMAHEFGNDF
ncbi:hypothetical protein AB4Z50_16000 [Paenibacillus sp. 2TAB26]|uniref:hypothetical protein n=1 Tax=Paenibacillus sp. 2TAB26 TaxID=3233005 RepID=UPI003F9672E5